MSSSSSSRFVVAGTLVAAASLAVVVANGESPVFEVGYVALTTVHGRY